MAGEDQQRHGQADKGERPCHGRHAVLRQHDEGVEAQG